MTKLCSLRKKTMCLKKSILESVASVITDVIQFFFSLTQIDTSDVTRHVWRVNLVSIWHIATTIGLEFVSLLDAMLDLSYDVLNHFSIFVIHNF